MKVELNAFGMLNEHINDSILKGSDDSPAVKEIIELCNRHGIFGLQAMTFIMELALILQKHAGNKSQ